MDFNAVRFATACLLLTLASPGHTQATDPPAVTQTKPAAGSTEEPKAREVLNQMIAAYTRPDSFSLTLNSLYGGPQSVTSIRFKKPNKVLLTTSHTGGDVRAVSDGKYIYTYRLNDKRHYTKAKVSSSNREVIFEAVLFTDAHAVTTGSVLCAETAFAFQNPSALTLGNPWFLGKVRVETLTVGSDTDKDGPGKMVLTLGKEDHLLRHIDLYGGSNIMTEYLGEMIEQSPLDTTPLPDSLFTFTPPAGAKIVGALSLHFDPKLVEGAIPPTLNAIDTAGKPVSLKDYKGKVVLLDYWATWCAPCLGEMPTVAAAYKKYHTKGLEIVGVSLDDATTRDNISAVVKNNNMTWRQVCDGKGWTSPLAKMYGVDAIPFTLLIGRDGKIEAVSVRGENLEPAIRRALAKK